MKVTRPYEDPRGRISQGGEQEWVFVSSGKNTARVHRHDNEDKAMQAFGEFVNEHEDIVIVGRGERNEQD